MREFLSIDFNSISILDVFRDNWGRKWCHLVAMDAIFFRDRSAQYDMNCVDRELTKAFTSFRPQGQGPDHEFGIATGNWGCGAFNGDKYVKGMC
jgi:poly(ADP-ribose) glycohydrolase